MGMDLVNPALSDMSRFFLDELEVTEENLLKREEERSLAPCGLSLLLRARRPLWAVREPTGIESRPVFQ